ncbi:molybdate ABC transporter substrate-binding protein [Prosthecodimorpha staleyi]|uniref:Molybdate ABC transporter substrate-binding protein n=1 Tax=Prosthecodimorpha staleyi TaxID=2840188 RepID=A0A947GFU8_9HYPH|nr:molybdate ABC transporter substrate-binding protein [Prosthecodimorpha staleyi]MBT9291035.1 molybdate ABC transporter substrate-binding protein [Prosthecodimorpha staleyi]
MSILRRSLIAGLAALAVAVAIPSRPVVAQSGDVVVFAAASLKNALDEIAADYTKKTGKKVAISYAASSALARQIEQGAPAQVFVSADQKWMDYAAAKGLIEPASRSDILGNRIVLVAPKDVAKPIEIKAGFDLGKFLGNGRLAIGAVASVPAGTYAKESLEKLGAWDGVKGKLAEAESVRAALLLVSRGETPYGIVYQTDAAADPNVAVVGTFPPESHTPILYPATLVKDAGADGTAFLAFMRSAAARKAYEKQGFTVLY